MSDAVYENGESRLCVARLSGTSTDGSIRSTGVVFLVNGYDL